MRQPVIRRAVVVATVATGLLAIAGCGGGASAGHSDAASSSTTTPSDPAAATTAPEGLTPAQIKAALPKASDLPKGWKVDPTGTLTGNMTSQDKDGVTPTTCSSASQVQQNFNFVAPSSAHGNIDFVAGQQGPFSGVTVYSFAAPYPAGEFAAIRAAVAKCSTYQETEDDGTQVTDNVALIDVPPVGDESIGLEVTSAYQGVQLDLIIVLARSGNTLVAVEDAGAGTAASAARAEKLLRTTLTRLTHP